MFVVAIPFVGFALVALLRGKMLRSIARLLFTAAALTGTILVMPSMNWLSAVFALTVSTQIGRAHV